MFESVDELLLDGTKRGEVGTGPCVDDHVDAHSGEVRPMVPKDFAQHTLDAIPYHRGAALAGGGDSEPKRTDIVGQAEQRQRSSPDPDPASIDLEELPS